MELSAIEIMRAVAVLLAIMVMFDGLDTIEALEYPQPSGG